MTEDEEKKALLFRKRQRIQWAPPAIINKGTMIYQVEFAEDVELISLFVHPDLLTAFEINDIRIGSEGIYNHKVDGKRFDNGGLRFTQNPLVRVGTLITMSVSNKSDAPRMFLANFIGLAQLKN